MVCLNRLVELSGKKVWRVGIATTSIDHSENSAEYFEGKPIPQRKYACGVAIVEALTETRARRRAEESIRDKFMETFTDISLYDVVRLRNGKRIPEQVYLPGLKRRFDWI